MNNILYFIYSINVGRFQELASELSDIFVTSNSTKEKTKLLFYYPFQKATKFNKAINAGGVLYEKYLNVRKVLLKYKIISKNDILIEGSILTFKIFI